MEYLVIFLFVAALGMRYRWERRGEERAARIKHRAAQIGKANPGLDPVQREKAAKRAMRGDGLYQILHGLPRFRGDFGDGWRAAKDAHHEWVKRTGKKPGVRNAVKAAREAHRERVRNGQPCAECGTRRRVAFREDMANPRWLCRDHWKAAPKKDRQEPPKAGAGERTRRKPTDPTSGSGPRHSAPDSDEPGNDRARQGGTRPADEPRPPRVTVSVGQPISDPATGPTYPPDEAAEPQAIGRGQQAIIAPPTGDAGPTERNNPVTDLTPSGGGALAPTGEAIGIEQTRQQLAAFAERSVHFQALAERAQAASAAARDESMRMAAAAEALSASMEANEVDPQTVGEVGVIFEALGRLNASVQGLESAAGNVHEAADGVTGAAGSARRGMDSRHGVLEEAHKGAPVRAAKREFYED